MRKVVLITFFSITYLQSQSFKCSMSHSEVKKRLHILKAIVITI